MGVFQFVCLFFILILTNKSYAQNHLRIFCESTLKTEQLRAAVTKRNTRVGARSFVLEQKSNDCQVTYLKRPLFEKKPDGKTDFKRPVVCNGDTLKRMLNEGRLESLPPKEAPERWPLQFRAYLCEECSFHKKEGDKFVPLPIEQVRRLVDEVKQKAQDKPFDYEKPLEPGYIDFYGTIIFEAIDLKEKPRGYSLKVFSNSDSTTGDSDKFAAALVAPQDAISKYKKSLIGDGQTYRCFKEEVVDNEPPATEPQGDGLDSNTPTDVQE